MNNRRPEIILPEPEIQRELGRRTRRGFLIGGIAATVEFAGLVAPGEFQFNVIVPSSLANGDQPVTVTYNGFTTQTGTLLTLHQ